MTKYCGPIQGVVHGIYDGPHATPPEAGSGPVFLGIKNVTTEGRLDLSELRHVSEEHYPKWTRRVTPQANDIVFSYEATLHRYAVIPEGFRGCLGRRMALLRPNTDKVIPRFLHYYLLSKEWRSVVESNVINGATVDRIPLSRLPDFEIKVPDLSVQRRVASILSAYDDLIENSRRRIALLEGAARLLHREWFVHFRFPGYERINVIGSRPEGWEMRELGDILELRYGKVLKESDRIDGRFPVYGSSGIVGTHRVALVEGPAIIIGRKGNVGSVHWSATDIWPIDTVYFIPKDMVDYWLYLTLQSVRFQNTDASVPSLNRNYAYSRKIIHPNDNLRRLFNESVAPMFLQCTNLENYNRKLGQTRDMLLPRLTSVPTIIRIKSTGCDFRDSINCNRCRKTA